MKPQSLNFQLLGQKIVVKTQEEADLAIHAIQIAQNKINEIQSRAPQLGPQALSVLALVEIAGDLVRDRKKMHDYRHELDKKCTTLMTELYQVEELATRP
jgi:cell division protein ZapA (FtsZ GTPase activity inhibitor)